MLKTSINNNKQITHYTIHYKTSKLAKISGHPESISIPVLSFIRSMLSELSRYLTSLTEFIVSNHETSLSLLLLEACIRLLLFVVKIWPTLDSPDVQKYQIICNCQSRIYQLQEETTWNHLHLTSVCDCTFYSSDKSFKQRDEFSIQSHQFSSQRLYIWIFPTVSEVSCLISSVTLCLLHLLHCHVLVSAALHQKL